MPRARARETVTVRDVARLARVSIATVSRAISRPDVVRPETRARVAAAIERLDYVSHGVARALSNGRTLTIGAVIPTLDNAIYAVSTHALQMALEQAGYTLLVASHEFDLDAEARIVRAFLGRGVDALVLVGTEHAPETHRQLEAADVPCVLTWSVDRSLQMPCVGFDNRAAGSMITEHLLALGHREFAMITGVTRGNDRARDRLLGVQRAVKRAGAHLPPERIVEAPYSLAAGRAALAALVARSSPTAVICGNDVLAIGAIQEAQHLGLAVPGELSVTGLDDMALATVVTPALTTVRFPIAEVGVEAARHLLDRLRGAPTPARRELPISLVVRASTAAPRARRRARAVR